MNCIIWCITFLKSFNHDWTFFLNPFHPHTPLNLTPPPTKLWSQTPNFTNLRSGMSLPVVLWLEMPFLFHEFPNLFSLFIASLRFYLKKCFLWKSFRLKTNQVFPHRCSYAYTRTGLFVFVFFLSHWCVLVSHQIKSMAYDRMHYLSPTSCLALRRQSISVEC